jgi:hypothetical protein
MPGYLLGYLALKITVILTKKPGFCLYHFIYFRIEYWAQGRSTTSHIKVNPFGFSGGHDNYFSNYHHPVKDQSIKIWNKPK